MLVLVLVYTKTDLGTDQGMCTHQNRLRPGHVHMPFYTCLTSNIIGYLEAVSAHTSCTSCLCTNFNPVSLPPDIELLFLHENSITPFRNRHVEFGLLMITFPNFSVFLSKLFLIPTNSQRH